MILLAHTLFGAAIGSLFAKNIYLAIILAFLTHYLLDLLPHAEYSVKNLETKQWHKSKKEIAKVVTDILGAFILVYLFSNNNWTIYVCAVVALIPDFITVIDRLSPNKITTINDNFHIKLHFWRNKKIPILWKILTQVIIAVISIILLQA